MSRSIRWTRPYELTEVTSRTLQGRWLLRPSRELNRRILGVVGRAQRREAMTIHGVVVLSNHYHLLLSPESGAQLARFMGYVQGNIAREAGDLHDWSGPFWQRRYDSIPVSADEETQIGRLRYVLAHGIKEGLVARARDWPGVHSALALTEGRELEGVWYDRTALYEGRRRGQRLCLEDVAEVETVELSPLPCWAGLEPAEVQEEVASLLRSIEAEEAARRRAEGLGVVGAKAVCRRSPQERPARLKRSPAPRFHTTSQEAWCALRDGYNAFVAAYRAAAELLRQGVPNPPFPPGSFPPGLPYVADLEPG